MIVDELLTLEKTLSKLSGNLFDIANDPTFPEDLQDEALATAYGMTSVPVGSLLLTFQNHVVYTVVERPIGKLYLVETWEVQGVSGRHEARMKIVNQFPEKDHMIFQNGGHRYSWEPALDHSDLMYVEGKVYE